MTRARRDWHPETTAVRAGREDGDTALAPSLHPSTTHVIPDAATGQALASAVAPTSFYNRLGNKTVRGFEDAVAALEGADAARAFASGMGAVSAVVLGICSTGDHVVTQQQLYGHTQLLFTSVCPRFGIDVTFVDGTEPGAFAAAVRPGKTVLALAETPANPRLDLVDLEEFAALKGPVTVVDSTFATPLGQRPLDIGADLVLHSATKGLAGHNDATLGVIAGSDDLITWIYGFSILHGATASPFDALNGLRGIRTLGVRFPQQCETALRLSEALEKHPEIEGVRYPGLPSHPQHDLAKRQMTAYGTVLSVEVSGGRAGGERLVEQVEIAQPATSLGGPETLVTHPASTTHVNLTPDELAAAGISEGTVRISAGLEHPDDVVADFLQALDP